MGAGRNWRLLRTRGGASLLACAPGFTDGFFGAAFFAAFGVFAAVVRLALLAAGFFLGPAFFAVFARLRVFAMAAHAIETMGKRQD